MRNIFLVIFGTVLFYLPIFIEASEASQKEYIELINRYPKAIQAQGSFTNGEIEIVLDKDKMASIEKSTGRDVGIIAQDKY
ncbi:MAG: hypothetical protein HZB76_06075 [Chlamydiae bacterium]|nr:hypothetical protein [Chlamydiota bacterium]